MTKAGPLGPPFVFNAHDSRAKPQGMRWYGVLSLAALFGGCAVGDVDGGKAALSEPGPWVIPPETLAIGDTMQVEYTGAGAWTGPDTGMCVDPTTVDVCANAVTPGAMILEDWLKRAFPQIDGIGGFCCRHIRGDSSTTSVHSTGRALDVHIPLHNGEADNDLGDPVGNYLIEHAEEIGIQYIIWDRWTWSGSRAAGEKSRMYNGAHDHHDHLHIELSVEASNAMTPWFAGLMALPEVDCPSLPADGGVISETSECFAAYGPATYWRSETGVGHDGSLLWTNAFENDAPGNWARWHLRLPGPKDYRVEVYIEPMFGVHKDVRYALRHDGGETVISLDQSAAQGWTSLGEYQFAGDGDEHLSVYDNADMPVLEDQRIAVDAVRLLPASNVGLPPTGPPSSRDAVGGCTVSDSPRPSWPIICLVLGILLWTPRRNRS